MKNKIVRFRANPRSRVRIGGTRETYPAEFADPGEARIAALRRVLEGKQYAKIDGQMVDSFTASAIVQVYDALNDANKAKYRALTVPKMAGIAWKFVKNPARGFTQGPQKRATVGAKLRRNPVRIVHNRLLGGWYIVRGPHQTPLGGRFNSKAEAEEHLRTQKAMRDAPRRNPGRRKQYRGKYPFAIREIYSTGTRGEVEVIAHNGMKVRVHARDTHGILPQLGEDIRNYDMIAANRASVVKNPLTRRSVIVLTGKRSGTVYAYGDAEGLTRAELVKSARSLAERHREPVTVQRVQVAEVMPKMRGNPAPREGVARAARRFARFTGHKAEAIEMLPFPAKPDAGLAVGPVLMLGYEATRDGVRQNYLHKFARHARPMLVASDDGNALYLIGGRYTFTERGIVDKRK